MYKICNFFILIVLLSIKLVFSQEEQEFPIITEVLVSGNKFVNTVLIKKQLRTQKGKRFSRIDINKDIKRLYQLNYFSKIDVDIVEDKDIFKVIFIVTEKPVIDRIIFIGNRKFKSKMLLKEMSLKEDQLLNEKLIANDILKLKEFYEKKGYLQCDINYEIEDYEDQALVDIKIIIDEGKKIRIKKINIIGTEKIKEKKLLRKLKTKKRGIFRSGFYEEVKFSEDLDLIKGYYQYFGYIDIKINNIERTFVDNNSKVIIDIHISEGDQYIIGDIEIVGNTKFSIEQLLNASKLKQGEIFLPENLNKDHKKIRNYYFSNGYIDARIDVDTFSKDEPYVINVRFKIVENEISFIDKIKIIGNEKTKDVVIRRELNLKPGDKFDGVKMEVANLRLKNLGFFKNVDIYPDPSKRDQERDLIVEVEEDRTGELGFGAGYSSVDHLIGGIERAAEILRRFALEKKCNVKKLIDYSVNFTCIKTKKIIGYNLEKAGVPNNLLKPLEKNVKNSSYISLSDSRKGALNKKWKIIINDT
ncbi:outer membrane protein assembly factor BamA [bacterium B13(2017)]|nr:outer membrane protein assembly factor BamA [bacterium B13(2017)]